MLVSSFVGFDFVSSSSSSSIALKEAVTDNSAVQLEC